MICSSRKKTGFLGFLCAIKSVGALFQDLIACEHPLLRYLLTYKLSQDHIELFFAAVRSSYVCNNNPTALQFRSAYKRMLVRHEISCESGNCHALDCTVTTLPTLRSSTATAGKRDNRKKIWHSSKRACSDRPRLCRCAEYDRSFTI